jgi:hypothetical protein
VQRHSGGTYFTKACAHVVQLRRDLAAAEHYERLSARATKLREMLAQAPIVPTSDPLPASFNATPLAADRGYGRRTTPYTMVVEIVSCLGLAGFEKFRRGRKRNPARGSLKVRLLRILKREGVSPPGTLQTLPKAQARTLPTPSLRAAAPARTEARAAATRTRFNRPYRIVLMWLLAPCVQTPRRAVGEG